MADMKLFLELLIKNAGFRSGLNSSGKDVSRFAQGAKREIDALRSSAQSVAGVLAGLGITYGALQNQAASARLDKGLTQTRQTAQATKQMAQELRHEFFRMGTETGRQIEGLKEGFDALNQSGLSWKASLESTKGINIASAVTGSNEAVLAKGLSVGAEQFHLNLEQPGKALEILDKMTVAGRLGSAELENLSPLFARVGGSARAANFDLEKTLAFIESLSYTEKEPERLGTLAESTLRVFTNGRYMATAQKATGIKFFADDGSRRDPIAVLEDIKKKYKTLKTDLQRFAFIQKAFGQADLDTIKGIQTLLNGDSLVRLGDFYDQIKNAGGTLKKDLPDAIGNAADQVSRLKNALRTTADSFAKPINEAVTNVVKYLLDDKKLSGNELAGIGIGAIGAGYVGKRVFDKVASAAGTPGGIAMGKALEAATGVAPVFVTNWPGDGSQGGTGVAPGVPAMAFTGSAVGMFTPAIFAGLVGVASRAIGEALANHQAATMSDRQLTETQRRLEVMGGGKSRIIEQEQKRRWQNTYSAQVSDMFLPSHLAEAKRSAVTPVDLKNNITINMRVDKDGNVVAVSNDMNTSIDTNVNRGSFDSAIMRPKL